jgi:hypothetical protein
MTSSIRRVRRSASDWRTILSHYEQSGQSQRDFCRAQGVALASFLRWRQRLGAGDAHSTVAQREGLPAQANSFVEFAAAPASTWSIELELPHGLVLRVRP